MFMSHLEKKIVMDVSKGKFVWEFVFNACYLTVEDIEKYFLKKDVF